MLEKPNLPDESILSRVKEEYGLQAVQLTFLSLGADVNTAVYRLVGANETPFFLKLRSGAFEETALIVPLFLKEQGIPAIIAPLATGSGQYSAGLDDFKMILYPYIDGKDGYQVELTDHQWLEFGVALKGIHTAHLPPTLKRQIPPESFSPLWRELVRDFQTQVESVSFTEPVAAKLAAFVKKKRRLITHLVDRASQLALALQSCPLELVLCHSDIHAGNLLISNVGELYIVDWDNPKLAPKEHDLMHFGGSTVWNASHAARFYQGYGQAQISPMALAYYRCERIVQDIAEFCKQLLLTDEGGANRQQALVWFTGLFLPGHEVEIANKTAPEISATAG